MQVRLSLSTDEKSFRCSMREMVCVGYADDGWVKMANALQKKRE